MAADIVPAFSTLEELADKMGEAISDFSSRNTNVTVRYSRGTSFEPPSFLFGIEFTKAITFQPELSPALSFGDFGQLDIELSDLSLDGFFSIANEFGVIFASDESEVLKLLGSLSENNCTGFNPFSFHVTWERNDDSSGQTEIQITDCDSDPDAGGIDKRVAIVRSAFANTELADGVNVTLVGGEFIAVVHANQHGHSAHCGLF